MTRQVDCFFTPVSPWAYLGMARFAQIVRESGAKASWKPVNIGQVFASAGAVPAGQRPPSRQANRLQELQRWRDYLDMPLNLQPQFFPVNPEPACLLIAAAILQGDDGAALSEACLKAVWAEEKDLSDPSVLTAVADDCRLNGPQLLAASAAPEAAALIGQYTEEAIARGVVGSPCYLIDEQVYFGQDRLDFVRRALQG